MAASLTAVLDRAAFAVTAVMLAGLPLGGIMFVVNSGVI